MSFSTVASSFQQVLDETSGRMVILTQTPFLFAAVNDSMRASLFVRVSLESAQVVSDGQGFSVKTTRNGKSDYVQITASDNGVPPLFVKLVEYLLERVSSASSVEEGAVALIRSIEEYRRFVGQRRGRLSELAVRGVFAELVFLRTLIDEGMSPLGAVSAWRGPWARVGLGLHDFTFEDGRGVEVKSTQQPPETVRVSSPTQLIPTKQSLDLVVLPIENAAQASTAAFPFRRYALELGHIMSRADPVAAQLWEAAIDALSLDLTDEWYDRFRFTPGEWLRLQVRDGFPHLDVATLPAEISDVRYSLELAKLAQFSAPFDSLFDEMNLS